MLGNTFRQTFEAYDPQVMRFTESLLTRPTLRPGSRMPSNSNQNEEIPADLGAFEILGFQPREARQTLSDRFQIPNESEYLETASQTLHNLGIQQATEPSTTEAPLSHNTYFHDERQFVQSSSFHQDAPSPPRTEYMLQEASRSRPLQGSSFAGPSLEQGAPNSEVGQQEPSIRSTEMFNIQSLHFPPENNQESDSLDAPFNDYQGAIVASTNVPTWLPVQQATSASNNFSTFLESTAQSSRLVSEVDQQIPFQGPQDLMATNPANRSSHLTSNSSNPTSDFLASSSQSDQFFGTCTCNIHVPNCEFNKIFGKSMICICPDCFKYFPFQHPV
jgi:hypothetical protein